MTAPRDEGGLSRRLAELRAMVFGPRGRAAFARAVGVSPSTYNYYEKGRPAPADILARAAEVTGADLAWLMTGRGTPFPEGPPKAGDIGLSHPAQDILERFSPGGAASPEAAAAFQRVSCCCVMLGINSQSSCTGTPSIVASLPSASAV